LLLHNFVTTDNDIDIWQLVLYKLADYKKSTVFSPSSFFSFPFPSVFPLSPPMQIHLFYIHSYAIPHILCWYDVNTIFMIDNVFINFLLLLFRIKLYITLILVMPFPFNFGVNCTVTTLYLLRQTACCVIYVYVNYVCHDTLCHLLFQHEITNMWAWNNIDNTQHLVLSLYTATVH